MNEIVADERNNFVIHNRYDDQPISLVSGSVTTMRVFVASCFVSMALFAAQASASDGEPSHAGSDAYAIHAGDVLSISVWKETDLQLDVLVRPDGGISFPLLGELPAQGKSVALIAADIREKLQHYIPDPVVNVAVKQLLGNKIFVIGKVNRPGELVLNQPLDVVQALSAAGGMTPFADIDDIIILRRNDAGKQTAIKFDYGQVEQGQNLDTNIFLAGGDVVIVP